VTASGLFWGQDEVVTVGQVKAWLDRFEASRRLDVTTRETVGWDGLIVSGPPMGDTADDA
jgi:hypothetical protein